MKPTQAMLEAGNYKKEKRAYRGLTITIENKAGSTRSGVDPNGHEWAIKMACDYGYVNSSMGVDGDQVDCYIGQDDEADTVYVVHQRKAGDWKAFDEDKCMLGFASEEAAKAAYLKQYDDPRFLGPITAMPFAEFKEKVLATMEKPAMIKSILFFKSFVASGVRRLKSGKVVQVSAYENGKSKKVELSAEEKARQGSLFDDGGNATEQEKPVAKPSSGEKKEYRYAMVNRPLGIGTAPKDGLIGSEDRPEKGAPHYDMARNGVAVFSRKLTDAETKQFEMSPMVDGDDRIEYADSVIDGMGEYAKRYLDMANKNPDQFKHKVFENLKRGSGHVPSVGDIDSFAALVKDRIEAKKQPERLTSDKVANMKPGATVRDSNGNKFRLHAARHDWAEGHPIVNGKAEVNRDSTVTFHLNPDTAGGYPERNHSPIYEDSENSEKPRIVSISHGAR